MQNNFYPLGGIMRAFAYVRVSTREQDEEIQKRSINEFAAQKQIEIVNYFIDKGISGSIPFKQREGGKMLLSSLEKEKVDLVISWSLDRLGRSMLDILSTVLELEEKYNVRVITIKEEWLAVMDQNMRKLLLSILGWISEFEKRRMRERQIEAWASGKQKGRPVKVKNDVIEKYFNKYKFLSLKDIWKIMNKDGYNVSYSLLKKRRKELRYIKVDGEWRKLTS